MSQLVFSSQQEVNAVYAQGGFARRRKHQRRPVLFPDLCEFVSPSSLPQGWSATELGRFVGCGPHGAPCEYVAWRVVTSRGVFAAYQTASRPGTGEYVLCGHSEYVAQ